jgi:hypothetical protein
MSWWVTVTMTAMSALTLWILFKGYQVASATCGCGVADAANSQSRQMGYHLLILQ